MSGWTAVLPLIGVAVGALLQHWLSRGTESRKQLELLRGQAYVDYLRAVAKAAHAGSSNDRADAIALAADAKSRIAVYGTAAVVHALASFEHAGPVLDNPRSVDCFLALVAEMRSSGAADVQDLRAVLIGPEARVLNEAIPAPIDSRRLAPK